METETKVCVGCGEEKPVDQFKYLYDERPHCHDCESIERRRRELLRKTSLNELEAEELANSNRLYNLKRQMGYTIPGEHPTKALVDAQLERIGKLIRCRSRNKTQA